MLKQAKDGYMQFDALTHYKYAAVLTPDGVNVAGAALGIAKLLAEALQFESSEQLIAYFLPRTQMKYIKKLH